MPSSLKNVWPALRRRFHDVVLGSGDLPHQPNVDPSEAAMVDAEAGGLPVLPLAGSVQMLEPHEVMMPSGVLVSDSALALLVAGRDMVYRTKVYGALLHNGNVNVDQIGRQEGLKPPIALFAAPEPKLAPHGNPPNLPTSAADPAPIPAPVAEPAPQESHMSFLSKFKTEFEKLFHESPTWIHTGESVVAFAAPVVLAIIAQFDPAVALVAAPIVAEIKSDLSTVSVLIGDGSATPSLTAALNSVKANLNALLNAGHIKDAKIQADVTLVVSEIAALVGELPTSATAPAAAPVVA